jgi:hypothetical protein
MEEPFVNISEGARYIGVSEIFLRRRCSDRWDGVKPKFYRISGPRGRLRFLKSELAAYMSQYEGISGTREVKTETVPAAE